MLRSTSRLRPFAAGLVALIMMGASAPAFAIDDDTAATTEVAAVVDAPAPAEAEEPATEAPVAEVVESTDSAPADAAEPAAEAVADEPAVATAPIEQQYTAECTKRIDPATGVMTYTATYSPGFNPGTSGAYTVLQPAGEGNSQDSARTFTGSSVNFTLSEFAGTTVDTQNVIEIQTFYPNGGEGLEYEGPYVQVDLSGCTDLTPPPPVTVFVEAPVVNCVAGPSNDNVELPSAEGATVSISSEWVSAPQGEFTKTVTVVLDSNTVHGDGSYAGGLVYDNSGNCGQDVEIVLVPIPDMSGVIDACNPAGVVSNIIWTDELPPSDNFVLNMESADGTRTSSLKDTSFTTWTDGTVAPKVYADSGVVCEGEGLIVVTAVNGTFIDEPGSQFNLVFVPETTEGLEYIQIKFGNTLTVVAVVTDTDKYVQGNPEWFQEATDLLVPVVVDPEVPVVNEPEVPVVVVVGPVVNSPVLPVVVTPSASAEVTPAPLPLANPGLPGTGSDGPEIVIPLWGWIVGFIGLSVVVAFVTTLRRPAKARRSLR